MYIKKVDSPLYQGSRTSAGSDTAAVAESPWIRRGKVVLVILALFCAFLMGILPSLSLVGDLVYRAF